MRAPLVQLAVLALVGSAHADPRSQVGLDEHVGAAIPTGLELTTSAHDHVALGSFLDRKRPLVLVMAYAKCTMLCSVVLRGVADAMHTSALTAGVDYLPVIVSLDPNETPDEGARRQNKLLERIGHPGDRAAWPYLVGNEASIETLARVLGFRYAWDPQTQQFAHPAVVFIIAPDGRIAEYVRGVTFDGLDDAIQRARDGQLTPSVTRDVLACFHFDPALRRYETKISLLFRLGAALVLITLAGVIGGLVSWERRRAR